ncbi:immunoglobulin superfamily member 10 [Rhynchonycteris naso]
METRRQQSASSTLSATKSGRVACYPSRGRGPRRRPRHASRRHPTAAPPPFPRLRKVPRPTLLSGGRCARLSPRITCAEVSGAATAFPRGDRCAARGSRRAALGVPAAAPEREEQKENWAKCSVSAGVRKGFRTRTEELRTQGKGRGMTRLLVSFAAIWLAATPGGGACPRRCACYVPTEVHCTFRYLTSIPDSIPPNVERINLGYNSLVRFTETDFSGLSKLELLMLHSNGIHTVPARTFSDLQALQVLKMSYNKVRRLQKDTFYGLKSLTRLHMDHNNIEFINPEVFYGLTFLRLVHLEGNQLTKLHPDTFVSLRYLQIFKTSFIKYLHLSDNFLSSLPQEMVSYMPDLESLYLHGNPWTCDCHLKWLSDWTQEKPDVVKCKKDRSPSSPQQCPLCTKPRAAEGKPLATVPGAAFLCAKPTIDPSLKRKNLPILYDSRSGSVSPQRFTAPFGSLTLNMTDQLGNAAHMVCRVQKPSGTLSAATKEDSDHIWLTASFATFLTCDVDSSRIQPAWQILALYSDSPLTLGRDHLLADTPQLGYRYKQVAAQPKDTFTSVEADLRADPPWLLQDHVSLQLNRTATTLGALKIQYSSGAHVTLPRVETMPVRQPWTMIPQDNKTRLERTVLVGGTLDLACPCWGDPAPHFEWLLAEGSQVRAPYVSEDGRILIDKGGSLELQMADSFDTGVYSCICTNDVDADVLTYRVTVVEPDIQPGHENGAHHMAFAGDTLDLPCHSTGIPDASVSWVLPGNMVLDHSSKEKHIFNDTLRILQVTPQDQGHYRCIAANPSGVDVLVNRVSVKVTRPSPVEHYVETDGSGFDEPKARVRLKDSPAPPPLPPAPLGGEAGSRVSSTGRKHTYRALRHRQRGDSTNRRFREHRTLFPPSARRIDPRHWAALLEKAKKKTMPQKEENTTAGPSPLVTQLPKIPSEEADASGMLPPDEGLMVLATELPRIQARTGPADSREIPTSRTATLTTGTDISPAVSPHVLPPETPTDVKLSAPVKVTVTSKTTNPTPSSKMQDTHRQHALTVVPRLPVATRFQEAAGIGERREGLQTVSPVTAGVMIRDVNTQMLSGANSKADLFLASESATAGHQTPVAGGSDPRSNHFHAHLTQRPRTSWLPLGRHSAPQSQLRIPRNSTTNTPLSRRLSRRRKIWGRGRVIGPYRTPVFPRHRYGFVRLTPRGSSEESSATFSATELGVVCPSCSPTERLPTAGAALSSPSPFPATLPRADTIRVTAEGSTTLVYIPSLPFDNKPDGDTEKTTPTVKYFSAESTQVIPAGWVMTRAPTSVTMGETYRATIAYPRVSNTSDADRESVTPSPLPGPATEPSRPTRTAITTSSRRNIPWHQSFANNRIQAERSKEPQKFGSQKSIATGLPQVSPASATERVSSFHVIAHSTSVVQSPPRTRAPAHHDAAESHSPGGLPTAREPPSPPSPPTSPTLPSSSTEESSTTFTSMRTATPTPTPMPTPPAPAPATPSISHTARPGTQRAQSEQEPRSRNAPVSSPSQSLGVTARPAVTLPVPDAAEASSKPRVSAFLRVPPGNTARTSSPTDRHPGTQTRSEAIAELPQETTQALESPMASETTSSPTRHRGTTARVTATRHSAVPPFPSGSASPVPDSTSAPPCNPSTVTNNVAAPVSWMMPTTTFEPTAPSRDNANAWQFAAEAATSPSAKFTTRTAADSSLSRVPARTTGRPQHPKWTPPRASESHSWRTSGLGMAWKGRRPGGSLPPRPGSPGGTVQASDWDPWETVMKSGSDEMPAQKTPAEPRPSEPSSGDMFERPRIVGGKAASFTVPANSDAFLPCEAVGRPVPTIHWARVSSGLDLSASKQDGRFRVLANGTLSIRSVGLQDRGQYLCSASNPFGREHLLVTLSVVSYPARILGGHAKEITIHSGSTAELRCTADGRPRPVVSWVLANQTVVSESLPGSGQALVTADGTLVIRNLTVYDRGFYKCVASNSAGQDSLLVRLQVIAAPPVILEQKRQVLAGTLGGSVNLPCTAKGTPQPSVHWALADGTQVKPFQVTDSNLSVFANGTLYIRNVASSDRGTYECIATSSTGSDRRVVVLTVEERETIPRIELASQAWNEVNFGDKLLLNCSAIGEPKPKIMWRLPSKAVVDQWHRMGRRVHVYPNGSLSVGSVTEKDGGDYLCVARNKRGEDLTLLHVSLRLKPAKIDHKPHSQKQVFHGKDFRVDCKASGSPVPQIWWSLPDGTMVDKAMQAAGGGPRAGRYTLFDNGTLYLGRVGTAEEGDYTCYAQNSLGKDEMKVRLTVLTAAPRIKQRSQANGRARAGDTAVLDCEVVGEPTPKILWLLPSSDMISFSKDRYTLHANGSLSISKVQLLDSGEYVCVARNPSGDDTKMYKLEVVAQPPLINGLYTNKTVVRATAVRHSKKHLDCRAEGSPAPQITWVMPDNVFLTAPYYGGRITVHKNGTLEIRNVRSSDSAEFVCVARNEGGESLLVVRLEVLEMLRRPTFQNPFNEKIVTQLGKPTALNCSVDGNPPPEVIWILPNGTRLPGGPQRAPYRRARNGSLLIHKATRDEAGKYRCGARNKVGYIEKLIVLEIGQKPVILTNALGTVYGVSGEALSLHCVSDGSPKPSVQWSLPSGYVIDRPRVSGKYLLHRNGTLVLREVTASDRGSYVCTAQNSVGHARATVPVMVVAYPPRITNRPPRSILTRTGAAVQLHCGALGAPKPEITWETPDHSLLSRANQGRTRGAKPFQPQGTLVIQNPQTSDSGAYRCTAKNTLGSDFATTYVQVI